MRFERDKGEIMHIDISPLSEMKIIREVTSVNKHQAALPGRLLPSFSSSSAIILTPALTHWINMGMGTDS